MYANWYGKAMEEVRSDDDDVLPNCYTATW